MRANGKKRDRLIRKYRNYVSTYYSNKFKNESPFASTEAKRLYEMNRINNWNREYAAIINAYDSWMKMGG